MVRDWLLCWNARLRQLNNGRNAGDAVLTFLQHSGIFTFGFSTSYIKNNTINSHLWTCRVYHFPPQAVWTCSVYPFPLPAVWTYRMCLPLAVWMCRVYVFLCTYVKFLKCRTLWHLVSPIPDENVTAGTSPILKKGDPIQCQILIPDARMPRC